MRLRQISEAGFLRQLRHYLGAAGGSVRLSVGDDAAVLTCPAGYSLVLTCDAAVEGCHFRRDWLSEAEIGDRAVRACISDLAAMGAQPAGVLLTLVISPDETEAAAHALVHGAAQAAEVLGTRLIGGETVGNPGPLMLDVMAAGFVPEGRELRRDGAQPGDRLLVSGTLGDSAAGLAALQATLTSPAAHVAVARYRQPKPHLALGALLAATEGVHAVIDISDGLVRDAGHIAEQSGVRLTIRVTKIPISSHCRAVAQALGVDPLLWALGGGEDFELLFAVEAQVVNSLCACIKTQLGIDVVEIGEVTRGKGVEVVKADGCALRLPQTGWDQFTRT